MSGLAHHMHSDIRVTGREFFDGCYRVYEIISLLIECKAWNPNYDHSYFEGECGLLKEKHSVGREISP